MRDDDTRLIGLTGYKGSGKDTAASFLAPHGYVRYALARPIVDGLCAMFDLDEDEFADRESKEAVVPDIGVTRRFLAQTLGTEWGRDIVARDLWLRVMYRRCRRVLERGDGVVISDVRFDDEAEWIREQGGTVVRIRRSGLDAQMGQRLRATRLRRLLWRLGLPLNPGVHPSEFGVSDHLVDFEIVNDGPVSALRDRMRAVADRLAGGSR